MAARRRTRMGNTGIFVSVGACTHGESLGILRRAHAWRERIAGVRRHVCDTAALHALRRTHRSLGEHGPAPVAIVGRIGVDEAADRAVLRRDLGLDAAPRAAVLRDHDRALHGDAAPLELLVVGGYTVVDEHQRTGDVAVNGIGVVRGELFGVLRGRWIACDGRFLQHCLVRRGSDHLQHALDWRGEQHVERLDVRIPADSSRTGRESIRRSVCRTVTRRDAAARRAAASCRAVVLGRGSRGTSSPTRAPRARTGR